MNAANMANAYKRQQILTATPAELTLMLYNGAIRFVTESMLAIEKKEIKKAHDANMRAQKIVRELMLATDMKQEISQKWILIDEYILHCLVQGNIKKDKLKLEEAKKFLLDFRDAWVQAMKQVCMDQGKNNAASKAVERKIEA
ncbi:Flagellar protein FliS [Sporomusa ovata DSM 2662]|uniref:Flagellar biosynthesis protein FliS n=1 Tax=Sporomusa ovata TaxID=2378 RepID=A0A0U1KX45_9FIRM|nr:flagellar export chaperone FliS [Sporomusa ovata]EQB28344.1 flagellar protein FliS [Sporomusa ovata DSM 2662]CQR71982.1 Flagellar biosynthesis protein FliS [Sporomusa ovata]